MFGKKKEKSRASDDSAQATSSAINYIWWISGIGLFVVFFSTAQYSAFFRSADSTFNWPGGMLACMASLLGYGIGGLLGFLMGFPRYSDTVLTVPNLDRLDTSQSERLSKNSGSTVRQERNTNLERIVDWLTTLLIGASLANAPKIADWLSNSFTDLVFILMVPADPKYGGIALYNGIGVLIVVPFFIAGFLHLYLWTRRYIPLEWDYVEKRMQTILEDEIQPRIEKIDERIAEVNSKLAPLAERIKKLPITISNARLEQAIRALKQAGVEDKTIEDCKTRWLSMEKFEANPFENFGNDNSQNYILETQKLVSNSNSPQQRVRLKVIFQKSVVPKIVIYLLDVTFDSIVIVFSPNKGSQDVACDVDVLDDFVAAALIIDDDNPYKEIRLSKYVAL